MLFAFRQSMICCVSRQSVNARTCMKRRVSDDCGSPSFGDPFSSMFGFSDGATCGLMVLSSFSFF